MVGEHTSILVVGAGTFGLSTAWHLATRGYKNVKVIDRWSPPSLASAGHDINKIVRTEYANPLYTKLAHESIDAWQTLEPLASSGVFHKTGWVVAVRGATNAETRANFEEIVELTRRHGDGSGIESLSDADAIRRKVPQLDGEMKGWYGVWNSNAGWVEAQRAMDVLARDARKLGVQFVSGASGAMKELSYSPEGKVVGVVAEDGTVHFGDKVVLATGAWSESLFDFEGQIASGAYVRCHIQLTPEETEYYKTLPVVDTWDQGYFFPPGTDGVFKTCKSGYTQTNNIEGWRGRKGKTSVPRDPGLHPTDIQPIENQKASKEILEECLPALAKNEIVWSQLCHDTESVDGGFIISPHPSSPSSFFIATAGSGHAFKNFPVIGKYVVQCLEGTLSDEHREAWRWRPEIVGTDRDDDYTSGVHRIDLSELHGWKKDEDDNEAP